MNTMTRVAAFTLYCLTAGAIATAAMQVLWSWSPTIGIAAGSAIAIGAGLLRRGIVP